jgi:SSS family solute:Na+ symporter
MSSLDSVINSLSATTMQDVFKSFLGKEYSQKQELWLSKLLTVFWGTVCTIFAFFVGGVSDSIIVSINKIGSLANGPIMGVFALGILTKRANSKGAIIGLIGGFLFNSACWKFFPEISWPWWNVTGCLITFALGMIVSYMSETPDPKTLEKLTYSDTRKDSKELFKVNWNKYYWVLGFYGIFICAFCIYFS